MHPSERAKRELLIPIDVYADIVCMLLRDGRTVTHFHGVRIKNDNSIPLGTFAMG